MAQRGDGTIGCLITGERHSAQFRMVLGPSRLHQFREIAATDMVPAGSIAA